MLHVPVGVQQSQLFGTIPDVRNYEQVHHTFSIPRDRMPSLVSLWTPGSCEIKLALSRHPGMLFAVLFVLLLGLSHVSAFGVSMARHTRHTHHTHTRHLCMHFEEAATGNTALAKEALPAQRYVALNRFKVRKNAGTNKQQHSDLA
jgi:hypothetical protein